MKPIPNTNPRTEQATETPIPIILPEESGLDPELRAVPVAKAAVVVAPPSKLLVWLGVSLMPVAEVGEFIPVVVAAKCQTLYAFRNPFISPGTVVGAVAAAPIPQYAS